MPYWSEGESLRRSRMELSPTLFSKETPVYNFSPLPSLVSPPVISASYRVLIQAHSHGLFALAHDRNSNELASFHDLLHRLGCRWCRSRSRRISKCQLGMEQRKRVSNRKIYRILDRLLIGYSADWLRSSLVSSSLPESLLDSPPSCSSPSNTSFSFERTRLNGEWLPRLSFSSSSPSY